MLKHPVDSDSPEGPDLIQRIDQILQEGRGWAEAEAQLARVELAALKSQVMRLALAAALAGAAGLCMLLAMTQALILLVSAFLPGPAAAALAVAALMGGISVGCALVARRSVVWRTESIFFRWFGVRR